MPLLTLLSGFIGLVVKWYDRAYNHDDFYVAYLAWLRTTTLEPGHDYYVPNFTPLADLGAPLFHWFPESFVPLIFGKTIMLGIAAALVAATINVSRLLGAAMPFALLSGALLLWQPEFVTRISDIRADAIGTLLMMAAIIGLLRARDGVSGLLFGSAVAITYKLAVAGPFLLAALLVARRSMRWNAAARFVGGAALLPIFHVLWRLVADGPVLSAAILRQIFTGVSSGPDVRMATLGNAFMATPVIFCALAVGLVAMLAGGRSPEGRRQAAYALLATAFVLTYLTINPLIYPYNLLILLPLVTPLAAGLGNLAGRIRWRLAAPVIVAALSLLAIGGGVAAMAAPTQGHRRSQERVIEWVWKALEPHEHAFDWQGMHLGRPGIYHWWIYGGTARDYQRGDWFNLADEWRSAQVKLILANYRLGWMRPDDQSFLSSHFVWVDRCILVPGWVFTREQAVEGLEFDAFLTEAEYRWLPAAPQGALINNAAARGLHHLDAGPHRLSAAAAAELPERFALVHLDAAALSGKPPCPTEPLLGGFSR